MKSLNNENVFIFCVATVVIVVVLALFNIGWIYINSSEKVAVEAVKAGLVQQPLSSGLPVWVKPEDYKPYPISSFDAPRWRD